MGVLATIDSNRGTVAVSETGAPTVAAGVLAVWIGDNVRPRGVEAVNAVHKCVNALRAISTPAPSADVTQAGIDFTAGANGVSDVAVGVGVEYSATEDTVDVAYGADFLARSGQSISSAAKKATSALRDAFLKTAA